MDVPGKWELRAFLKLARLVVKQHGINRRLECGDCEASSPVCMAQPCCRKTGRIADSLKRYFQMQLGTGTRARVLEAVAARLRVYRRQLVTGHQLGLRMVGCSAATAPSAESGFHRDDTSSVLMPRHCLHHCPLLRPCVPRRVSVSYDAACYIKHVAKSHLRKNRPSTWPDIHRERFERALTKRRGRAIRRPRCLPTMVRNVVMFASVSEESSSPRFFAAALIMYTTSSRSFVARLGIGSGGGGREARGGVGGWRLYWRDVRLIA